MVATAIEAATPSYGYRGGLSLDEMSIQVSTDRYAGTQPLLCQHPSHSPLSSLRTTAVAEEITAGT